MNFVSLSSNSGGCHHKINYLSLNVNSHPVLMLSIIFMPASLSISTVHHRLLLSLQRLEPRFQACSFIVLTDRVSTNALWAAFQFSVREIVTQRPAFLWIRAESRYTIRIRRRLRIRFSLFLSLFRQFSTPQLLPISQSPVSPALLRKPNHRQLAKSLEERLIYDYFDDVIRWTTRIVLFLYFLSYLTHLMLQPPLKFRVLLHLSALQSYFYRAFWVVFFEELFWLVSFLQ